MIYKNWLCEYVHCSVCFRYICLKPADQRELTLHLIDLTLSQLEVVAIHLCSIETVIISWTVKDHWLPYTKKDQIFSKIWTIVNHHSHCTLRFVDWIFDKLFPPESEKKGFVIVRVLAGLTEGLFGVTSEHKTGGVESHRHRGTAVVTSSVEL